MIKRTLIFLTCLICLFSLATVSVAQESFKARLEDDSVSIGNPVYLYLTFEGARNLAKPDVPAVDGLRISYVGPSTKISVVNGRTTQSITHTYLVIPKKKGRFIIGPFFADHSGKVFKADQVVLFVSDVPQPAASSPRPAASSSRSPAAAPIRAAHRSDRIFLELETSKHDLYVNDTVIVYIKLYVLDAGLKDIQYPAFEHSGFSGGEYEEPEKTQEFYRGKRYNVLVFTQKLFAVSEGDHTIGPARLNCTVVERQQRSSRSSMFGRSIFDDDFFNQGFGYKTYPIQLESGEAHVRVKPFPREGRPSDFEGAVGDFSLDVMVDPKQVKVGDPVVVKTIIRGTGNLDTVTAPEIPVRKDLKTYEPQVSKKEGRKMYEQIVIPKNDKVREIPAISFSFFNPVRGKYETIKRGPFPIKVLEQPESEKAVKMVSFDEAQDMFYPPEELGKDLIYIKEKSGSFTPDRSFLYKDPVFWVVQAAGLIAVIGLLSVYRRKQRLLTDRSYARFLKAPKKARKNIAQAKSLIVKGDITGVYDVVFKTLQEYISGRLNIPPGNITVQVLQDTVSKAGCAPEIMNMLKNILSQCEVIRYASSTPSKEEAEKTVERVKRVISHLERLKF